MDKAIEITSHLLLARDDDDGETTECAVNNDYDGRMNLRILSIFMILLSSGIGTFFPLVASKAPWVKLPDFCFFFAKFFGSGVIIATGFVHLLEPASDSLTDSCLTGPISEYPWAFGICLMSLFVLFWFEGIARYYSCKAEGFKNATVAHSHFPGSNESKTDDDDEEIKEQYNVADEESEPVQQEKTGTLPPSLPGVDHFSHAAVHQDPSQIGTPLEEENKEKYHAQILSVLILEFGVVFHSVFIGLSLAVTDDFITLFIVLIFHQMFEGMGLGARLAEINWEHKRRWTPWLLALGFTLTTPIAIAIGLGVKSSFIPGSRKELISSGVFDAISAGILIYTGLVELMAHEFLFSNAFMCEGGLKRMIAAFIVMGFGCGIMALLGKWA